MKKILIVLLVLFTIVIGIFVHLLLSDKEYEEIEMKILFAGDLMFDRGVKKRVYEKLSGDYFRLFEDISNYINSFDYFVVNLEGPISSRGKKVHKTYNFRFETNVITALKKANIKIANLANNHTLDWDFEAFYDTIGILSSNEIGYFGIQDISIRSNLYIVEKSNSSISLKVGFLGFSEFLEGIKPSNGITGIALIDLDSLRKAISSAKKSVDFLVVELHWGREYDTSNNFYQKMVAKTAIDSGADLVIGHHPHVIQGYTNYNNRYVFYSLGNFIMDQRFSKETMEGLLVEVTLKKHLSNTNLIVNISTTNTYQDFDTLKVHLK